MVLVVEGCSERDSDRDGGGGAREEGFHLKGETAGRSAWAGRAASREAILIGRDFDLRRPLWSETRAASRSGVTVCEIWGRVESARERRPAAAG